jgi:hypothetical protein
MSSGPVDPKVKAEMKHSLNAFEKAARKAAAKVAARGHNNRMLGEALHTRQVTPPDYLIEQMQNQGFHYPTQPAPQPVHEGYQTVPTMGVQVGNYAVFPVPNANGKNRYDVANMTNGQKLVGGLHLVEAANGIVKLMNKGHSFYSPQVKQILEMEEKYVKHYQDAVSFRRKSKEDSKDAIMETRFEEAKLKAQQVKENLNNFCSKL